MRRRDSSWPEAFASMSESALPRPVGHTEEAQANRRLCLPTSKLHAKGKEATDSAGASCRFRCKGAEAVTASIHHESLAPNSSL
eukprot:4311538-Pleurochrysis_carterae.AAC.1